MPPDPWTGLDWWDLLGGAAGSLAYAMLHDGPIRHRISDFVIGGVAAIFLGPWLAASASVESLSGYRAVMFTSGLFGAITLRAATQYAETHIAELINRLIQKVLGKQASKAEPDTSSTSSSKSADVEG